MLVAPSISCLKNFYLCYWCFCPKNICYFYVLGFINLKVSAFCIFLWKKLPTPIFLKISHDFSFYFHGFFFFFPHHAANGILIPQVGIEHWASAVRTWSPNHWTTREFPLKKKKKIRSLIHPAFILEWKWCNNFPPPHPQMTVQLSQLCLIIHDFCRGLKGHSSHRLTLSIWRYIFHFININYQ